MFRFFESDGEVRTAISAVKSRTLPIERGIREFRLTPAGVTIGPALANFEGILSGLPRVKGQSVPAADRAED